MKIEARIKRLEQTAKRNPSVQAALINRTLKDYEETRERLFKDLTPGEQAEAELEVAQQLVREYEAEKPILFKSIHELERR